MEVNEFGDWAPATYQGIRYETYIALVSRLRTFRGRQLMRPNFGSDAYRYLDRLNHQLLSIVSNQALEGIEDINQITLTLDENKRNIVIVVDGRVVE